MNPTTLLYQSRIAYSLSYAHRWVFFLLFGDPENPTQRPQPCGTQNSDSAFRRVPFGHGRSVILQSRFPAAQSPPSSHSGPASPYFPRPPQPRPWSLFPYLKNAGYKRNTARPAIKQGDHVVRNKAALTGRSSIYDQLLTKILEEDMRVPTVAANRRGAGRKTSVCTRPVRAVRGALSRHARRWHRTVAPGIGKLRTAPSDRE